MRRQSKEFPEGSIRVRLGILERYIIPGWFLMLLIYPAGQALLQGTPPANFLEAVGFLAMPVATFLLTNLRVSLEVGSDAVVVHNIIRSRALRLVDIEAASGTYDGLKMTLLDGRRVVAQAVPKYNLSRLRGRVDRSDRIAAEILRRADVARRGAKNADCPQPDEDA